MHIGDLLGCICKYINYPAYRMYLRDTIYATGRLAVLSVGVSVFAPRISEYFVRSRVAPVPNTSLHPKESLQATASRCEIHPNLLYM